MLAIALGMFACLVIVRLFTNAFDASAETILDRVMEARAALPRIIEEEKPLVMSFGSLPAAATSPMGIGFFMPCTTKRSPSLSSRTMCGAVSR